MHDEENREKPFIKRRFSRTAIGSVASGAGWKGTVANMSYAWPEGYCPIAICSFTGGTNGNTHVAGILPLSTESSSTVIHGLNVTSGEITNLQPNVSVLFVKEDYVTYDF